MGGRTRSENMVKRLCIEDKKVQRALLNNDTARFVLLTGLNVFDKCGNCCWRMKCMTDLVDVGNKKFNIFPRGKIKESTLAKIGTDAAKYIMDHLETHEKVELMELILEGAGVEVDDVVQLIDEVFGGCHIYNDLTITVDDKIKIETKR